MPDGTLGAAVRWIAYAVETETLMGEITDATGRIGTLVNAARQYSQLDRAPYQPSDLRVLIKSTLTMLSRKLEGIELVKDFDPELPLVPCYPAELNQVWTNIVDNAVWAMGGSGTLTVRTRRENGHGRRRDLRHRPRHPRGGPAADLRAVLHDEGRRRGHRPGPGHHVADRRDASTTATSGCTPRRTGTTFEIRLPFG